MKYVNYNADTNEILGYYDDSIHNFIPEPNISITDEAWQEALQIGANYIENNQLVTKEIETDTKAQELSELEAEIKEIETHIRHAMLIDNTQVLPDLREEYKELLKRKEEIVNEN